MFDVPAVRAFVIVAEDREPRVRSGEPRAEAGVPSWPSAAPRPEARAIFPRGALRHVGAIALHLSIDAAADVDDAVDELRSASEVVLFADAMWLQTRLELLDVVAARSRHPAR